MTNLKNLQAAARRRGLSVRKVKLGDFHGRPTIDGFEMKTTRYESRPVWFQDITELRDELHARPIER